MRPTGTIINDLSLLRNESHKTNSDSRNTSPDDEQNRPPPSVDHELMHRAIVRLWKRMTGIYGHKWLSAYGPFSDSRGKPSENAETWRVSLASVGIDGIRRGLEKCIFRNDPWPPTLPQFLELCQMSAQDLGLPDLETAYRIAASQRPDWDAAHPIIWHARQAVGAYEMTRLPDVEARKRFTAVYEALVARAMRGEVFSYPVTTAPRLEYDEPVEVTAPGDSRAHLAAIRAMLRGGDTAPPPDPEPPPPPKLEPFHSDPKRHADLKAQLDVIRGIRGERDKPEHAETPEPFHPDPKRRAELDAQIKAIMDQREEVS